MKKTGYASELLAGEERTSNGNFHSHSERETALTRVPVGAESSLRGESIGFRGGKDRPKVGGGEEKSFQERCRGRCSCPFSSEGGLCSKRGGQSLALAEAAASRDGGTLAGGATAANKETKHDLEGPKQPSGEEFPKLNVKLGGRW